MNGKSKGDTQRSAFQKLARELECDEDEDSFRAKLVKVAKAPKTKTSAKAREG
jgi:hypothetical protein